MANAICNVFKEHLLKGNHNFSASGGDTYKIALYTSSKTVSATAITGYNATNEAANSAGSGYTAAGNTLTNAGVTGSSTDATAFCDFNDTSWTTVSTTARYAVIYQSSGGLQLQDCQQIQLFVFRFWRRFYNFCWHIHNTVSSNDASNAIIRISG
jgi:hypothetical protein